MFMSELKVRGRNGPFEVMYFAEADHCYLQVFWLHLKHESKYWFDMRKIISGRNFGL